MNVTLCLSCSLWLLNRGPRAHSSGPKGPFRPDVAFPTISSITPPDLQLNCPLGVELNWKQNSIQLSRRTQLNYIIVRRPLDLWNRMFNRHQAEITVMQFRGHSLPVHHSVVYHGNYLVPFHQPISAHTISSPNCHWNVSLPSGASPWNSISWGPGRRSKHNTSSYMRIYIDICCAFTHHAHIDTLTLKRTCMFVYKYISRDIRAYSVTTKLKTFQSSKNIDMLWSKITSPLLYYLYNFIFGYKSAALSFGLIHLMTYQFL